MTIPFTLSKFAPNTRLKDNLYYIFKTLLRLLYLVNVKEGKTSSIPLLIMTQKQFKANGKLLLTGEYFVLDGATALALPTQLGQSMTVTTDPKAQTRRLSWHCTDTEDNWAQLSYFLPSLFYDESTSKDLKMDLRFNAQLHKIFDTLRILKPEFLQTTSQINVETKLDFPWNWGLGSSSTLIYLLSQWAKVNPYNLLDKTFGGSGYDIACAAASGPILYTKTDTTNQTTPANFNPTFKDQLYFIHLGKKQNSREGITRYRETVKNTPLVIQEITALTKEFISAANLKTFEQAILEHETIIGLTLGLPRAKSLYFDDYWGEIKSLGAWGGDFVLATSNRPTQETQAYFNQKGFPVCLGYNALIL